MTSLVDHKASKVMCNFESCTTGAYLFYWHEGTIQLLLKYYIYKIDSEALYVACNQKIEEY